MAQFNYKELRNERGITAAELAERLGMTEKGVRMWETGERHPTIPKLIQLADMYGVSVDYILGRENTPAVQQEQSLPTLTEDEQDILRLFKTLSRKHQHQLMSYLYSLEEKEKTEEDINDVAY